MNNHFRTWAARLFAAALLLASAGSALAAVRYVDVNNAGAMWPYTSWATAATNIQDAVDAAVAGDEIVVTNGIYANGARIVDGFTTNRVVVDKALTLRSVNGPQSTIIDGGGVFRCVYLTNGASLSGFTLTNGSARFGGGVWCELRNEPTNAVVSHCTLAGNFAEFGGGGAHGGTLNNCMLMGNAAVERDPPPSFGEGGGAFYSALNNCTLVGNVADVAGGGAYACALNNCTLSGNAATFGGGVSRSTLNNCTLGDNRAANGGGASSSTLRNCTLTANSAIASGMGESAGGGASDSTLSNCTLTGNFADNGPGAFYCTLNNCIVYFNTVNYEGCTLNYSCTTPLPTNGVGNITNAPLFVNSAAGNYRLRPDSQCIDAGTNLSTSITNDLDGRPRPLDGNGDGLAAFDMGAYEYRTPLLVWQDSPNPTPPHADWRTAAHTIQDAVDAAVAGDEIVVTNGIYATVAVVKPLALRSLNGPQSTTIDGGQSNRCVYLTNATSLSGFTLTNGRAHYGGGLWCESTNAVVSNCVVSGNSSFGLRVPVCFLGCDGPVLSPAFAAGVSPAFAGGVYGGTLNNCMLSGNRAETYFYYDVGDFHWHFHAGSGGGAGNATLNNCTLTGNSAGYGGGAYGCILNNCTLTGNPAEYYGGGANFSTLNNCTLSGNSASYYGGGAFQSTLNNCTLTGNSASVGGGGASWCPLNNCIIYFNTSTNGANYDSSSTLNYSCTTPLPTNGVGNITNAPLFVNFASGNYRLRADSPCIDAGTNLNASLTNDLDGRPRPLDGNGDGLAAFDMGAYEYRTPLLVWQNSPNPTAPHADWETAAHTIQDAVDAAVAGDEIVVTNGIYATGERWTAGDGTTNRVAVNKPLNVRSINGPQFTTIDGGHSNRCVYLTNGASFSGFTMTNGFCPGPGAGVFCTSQTAVVSNCVMVGNFAYSFGGGGAYGGTLNRCLLTANYGNNGGGAFGCTLNNCTLSYNRGESSRNGFGGGAHSCTLNNCTLSGNIAGSGWSRTGFAYGGGAFDSALNNCTLTGNSADYGSGALGSSLNNCTVTGNSAGYYGGGVYSSTLNNCTATGNSAGYAQSANYDYSTLNYCCTTPLPTNGVGNITNAPLFVDLASGNLRLQSNSPCINAGLNAFAPAGLDLDGNPRIVGYTVDMGAYESQSAPSVAPQLSITSSGTNVILAWPTDYAGVFIQEDHYEAYFLYSTTNLVSPLAWRFVYPMPVVVNGQLVVTNSIDGTQRFYRIVKRIGGLSDVPCLTRGPRPCLCYDCISGVWTQFGNCRFCDEF